MLPERVYKFKYEGEDRVAMPLELKSGRLQNVINVFTHDFVKRAPREFHWHKISEVQDVTEKCVVVDYDSEALDYYVRKGYSVFEHGNRKLYVMKVPETI